jgi:uncharacterized protein YbaR (Trm112 family)
VFGEEGEDVLVILSSNCAEILAGKLASRDGNTYLVREEIPRAMLNRKAGLHPKE